MFGIKENFMKCMTQSSKTGSTYVFTSMYIIDNSRNVKYRIFLLLSNEAKIQYDHLIIASV